MKHTDKIIKINRAVLYMCSAVFLEHGGNTHLNDKQQVICIICGTLFLTGAFLLDLRQESKHETETDDLKKQIKEYKEQIQNVTKQTTKIK